MPPAFRFLLWPVLPACLVGLLSIGLLKLLLWATESSPPPEVTAAPAALPAAPLPFLQQWCYDCHGDGADKGGLAMDKPGAVTDQDWEKIRKHVLLRTMPPEKKPQPPAADRNTFATELLAWQASRPDTSPPPAFRRLSRREFARSLQDLLGTAPDPTSLPDEESAHGFDNNAGLQPLPPAVLDRYTAVIQETVRSALLPAPVPPRSLRFMPQEFVGSGGPSPDAPAFYETETADLHQVSAILPAAGRYRFSLKAYAHQAGGQPVQVRLMDGASLTVRSILRTAPEFPAVELDLPAGPVTLTFQLANPLRDPAAPDPHRRVRRLLVQEATLQGPLEGDATPSGNFVRRFGPVPAAGADWDQRLHAANTSLSRFARRAWRQPLTSTESSRLTGFAGQVMAYGMRYDEAISTVVQAILTSPRFLFLTDPAAASAGERPYAIASRLSHLLWSTLPDETLLSDSGTPWSPSSLRSSADRLLDDPRAAAFARDFAGQWLQLRNTRLSRPDPLLFPDITPELKASMEESAGHFFLHLVRENEPILRLLDAPYTFLDQRLAAFRKSPAPRNSDTFQKTFLTDPDEFGLLGQPAVLLLTSYPNRTSPVLRGKYILENLLGLEPPPPPPNVPTLLPPAPRAGQSAGSVRATLEAHRADPACASCHAAIDPLGFPLEAFDAIGRPMAHASADVSSITFTGSVLHSPADLTAWLTGGQGTTIVHYAAERLLTYAIARGLTPAEVLAVHRLADSAGGRDARFRDLLMAIITSPIFRGESLAVSSQRDQDPK